MLEEDSKLTEDVIAVKLSEHTEGMDEAGYKSSEEASGGPFDQEPPNKPQTYSPATIQEW